MKSSRRPGRQALQLAERGVRELIHSPPEARFNRLARLTRRALNARVGAISFFDSDGEWIKAVSGWNVGHLGPDRSLALGLLGDGSPVIIADMLEDPRTRNHPLVVAAPRYRFCALQPIVDPSGKVAGAIAVYDIAPRKITGELIEAISDVGEFARREMELTELGALQQQQLDTQGDGGRAGLLDELTRLWNRDGGLLVLGLALEDHDPGSMLGACVLGVDDLDRINQQHGRGVGDAMLRQVAVALVDGIRPGDVACRLDGDSFLLLVPDIDPDQLANMMDRVKVRVQSQAFRVRTGTIRAMVSIGGAIAFTGEGEQAEDVLRRASEAMLDGRHRKGGTMLEATRVAEAPGLASPASARQAPPARNGEASPNPDG